MRPRENFYAALRALAPERRVASQLLLDPGVLASASGDLGVCVEEEAGDGTDEGAGSVGEGGSWVIRPPP